MNRPAAIQRAGVFAELPGLLAEAGIDPAAVLKPSGIDRATLSPDTRLPFACILAAIERAAVAMDCPHLGLLLGQRFTLAHHGPIGRLMQSAPSLGQALLDFIAWQPGYSSGAIVYLGRVGEDHALGYGAAGAGSRILYDCVMSVGIRLIGALTGGKVRAEEVHFSHRQPKDRLAYLRCLEAVPVRFNQQRVCIVLSSCAMEFRLPGADPRLHRRIGAELREMVKSLSPDARARTRHALRRTLQRGDAGMTAVAGELAMHPRTLRRRLAAEETSFETVLDATRYDIARELIELTDLPIGDIGMALAYASHSGFTDAFRRWSGTSPSAWRRRSRQA
jgi:AraC-like DNA-binding protein